MRAVFVEAMKEHGWLEGRDFEIVESKQPMGSLTVESAAREMVAQTRTCS